MALKGLKGLTPLKGIGGGQKIGPKTGSPLGMMKKFMLYRNAFGNTPAVRARMGSMGPILGKPTGIASGLQKQLPGAGTGGTANLAEFHRMGLI